MLYTNPLKQEKKPLCKADYQIVTNKSVDGSIGRFISYLESIISGKRRGFFSTILKSGLLQISWIYLGTVKLRRWLYSRRILRAKHLPCKVISVGNVVVGGSGKTPAVIAVAGMIKKSTALNVAVLSRGYRSQVRCPAIVSDSENILLDPCEAGDEPYLLSQSLPGIPVLIGKDRIQTGLIAIRKWSSQVIILDDGFQYLRLARDIDMITVDTTRPFGFDHVLPRGYLREPLSTIRHADLILLTKVDQCKDLNSVRTRLAEIAPSVSIFESVYEPRSLYSLDTQQGTGLETIRGRSILAVCGIANPLSFVDTLRSLCPAKVSLLSFPDHHKYSPLSMEMIRRRAAESDVDIIVSTEKDAPKLMAIADLPVLVLKVGLKLVGATAERFVDFLLQRLDL